MCVLAQQIFLDCGFVLCTFPGVMLLHHVCYLLLQNKIYVARCSDSVVVDYCYSAQTIYLFIYCKAATGIMPNKATPKPKFEMFQYNIQIQI